MGFNKRRMESERATAAATEAEARRALGRQILEDAERLIATWNARQEAQMPMLFSPTNRLRHCGPALVSVGPLPRLSEDKRGDLRTLDRHPNAAIASLIPW